MLNQNDIQEILDKHYPSYNKQLKKIEDHIVKNIGSCERLLDAGCGNGSYTVRYGRNAKFLFGIDVNKQKINEARRNFGGKNISFFNRSVYKTGFEDEYFDVIFCQYTIEHLSDVEKAFKELNRVLKKDGKLIIITPSIFDPQNLLNKILPESVKSHIKQNIIGIGTNPEPVFYKFNYVRKLDSLAEENNMKRIHLWRTSSPMFFQTNQFLLILWIYLDKTINDSFFRFLKSTIYAVYKKSR